MSNCEKNVVSIQRDVTGILCPLNNKKKNCSCYTSIGLQHLPHLTSTEKSFILLDVSNL